VNESLLKIRTEQPGDCYQFKNPVIITGYLKIRNVIANVLLSSAHAINMDGRLALINSIFQADAYLELAQFIETSRLGGPDNTIAPGLILAFEAVACGAICNAALRGDFRVLKKILRYVAELDSTKFGDSIPITTINHVREAWKMQRSANLLELCEAYTDALLASKTAEVHCAALEGLVTLLDEQYSSSHPCKEMIVSEVARIGNIDQLFIQSSSPSLQNIRLQAKGWTLLFEFTSAGGQLSESLRNAFNAWVEKLHEFGDAQNVSNELLINPPFGHH